MLSAPQTAGDQLNPADIQNHTLLVVPVEFTDTMMPGVVSVPHGWGHNRRGAKLAVAATMPGESVNDIIDPARIDELTGTSALSGQPVEVTPA